MENQLAAYREQLIQIPTAKQSPYSEAIKRTVLYLNRLQEVVPRPTFEGSASFLAYPDIATASNKELVAGKKYEAALFEREGCFIPFTGQAFGGSIESFVDAKEFIAFGESYPWFGLPTDLKQPPAKTWHASQETTTGQAFQRYVAKNAVSLWAFLDASFMMLQRVVDACPGTFDFHVMPPKFLGQFATTASHDILRTVKNPGSLLSLWELYGNTFAGCTAGLYYITDTEESLIYTEPAGRFSVFNTKWLVAKDSTTTFHPGYVMHYLSATDAYGPPTRILIETATLLHGIAGILSVLLYNYPVGHGRKREMWIEFRNPQEQVRAFLYETAECLKNIDRLLAQDKEGSLL